MALIQRQIATSRYRTGRSELRIVLLHCICLVLVQQCTLGRCDKVPVSSSKRASGEQELPKSICEFPQRGGAASIKISYNASEYKCVGCKKFRTLVPRRHSSNACKLHCDGIRCEETKPKCVPIKGAGETVISACMFGRAARPKGASDKGNGGDLPNKSSQIPLIIGFTVGGILLAIVVAGIFLGRHQKADDSDVSEVMTTPISLSHSEWQANGSSSSGRRREENLRVQEASTEDLTAVPLYTLQGFNKEYRKDENGNEYLLKAPDDASSMGQESYRDSDFLPYYQQNGISPIRSNRSSDVILEDGYVPGGNFVGSADPQVRRLLTPADEISPNENGGFEAEDRPAGQHYFDRQTPGSMAHDSICMSLTHSTDYGGVEYVIEDQDLVAFDAPTSFSKHKRTPARNGIRILNGNDEDLMQIHLQYKDGDSDFGDNESHPSSAARRDKNDVFFSSDTQSPDGAGDSQRDEKNSDKPHVDSGIEGSYNSKDSCEVIIKDDHPPEYEAQHRSWNDNHKGRSSEHLLGDQENTQIPKRYNMNRNTKSESFSWKSPSAPTHSSSRKQSAPIHCTNSEQFHPRPQPVNLTHVFVDVHRNMASSDEDLLSHSSINMQSYARSSISDSDASSTGDVPLSAFKPTPEHLPFDAIHPSHASPVSKRRNKSMYVLRNGRPKMGGEWAPRTVRFSSSGSGEYAIPFGSLVP